ncbi:hypothetical protein ES708_18588 [subsurface metagenome]
MFGTVDSRDDGPRFPVGRGWVVVAVLVQGFAGFAVDEAECGHGFLDRFGIRFGCRFLGLVVSFEVVFEHAVFALEAAFGGGEIAQDEVVVLDFVGLPCADGRIAVADDVEVVFAFNAEATPFGLGSFDDEAIEDGVFGGVLVGIEPGVEQEKPVGFGFAGDEQSSGAHTVAGGVAGRGLTPFRTCRTRSAGVAFLIFFVMSVRLMIRGGFGRIGVEVFRWLSGVGKFVFESHMFTKTWSFGEFGDG